MTCGYHESPARETREKRSGPVAEPVWLDLESQPLVVNCAPGELLDARSRAETLKDGNVNVRHSSG
jgi:hypothetical protein